MHPAAFSHVAKSLAAVGIKGKRILEIGSADVNATEQGLSLRAFCESAGRYHGIDERPGDGVDQVASAADYDGKGVFDIVISTEALEHTPEPRDILDCAWRALKPGGTLILTCAGPGRPAHNCDGTPWSGNEHYANIDSVALGAWLNDAGWVEYEVAYNDVAKDVYATATKPSDELAISQAQAWLQSTQGDLAGAANMLSDAIAKVDQSSIAAIRAQMQLIQAQNAINQAPARHK